MMENKIKRFWIVLIAMLAWMMLMRPFTPREIVQFELAKTSEAAMAIITKWGTEGVNKARLSIYLDFVFLILYAWAISLACRIAAKFSGWGVLIRISMVLSKIVWVASVLDIIENCTMLITLTKVERVPPLVSFYCAAFKFAILGLTLLFILLSIMVGLLRIFKKDKI